MHFLITNDDGIVAPGLDLLQRAAEVFGKTTTIAPKIEQSGVSHRLTFDDPLKLEKLGNNRFQLDGTPGDCVRVAVATQNETFDWVLSGVNDGANMGVEICYSGTVAAAREAAILGIPSVAFSQYRRKYAAIFDWQRQLDLVKRVLEGLLREKPDSGTWINVNFPDVESQNSVQVVNCPPDMSAFPNKYVETENGLVMSFSYKQRPQKTGHDVEACFSGNVSVSHHRLGEL